MADVEASDGVRLYAEAHGEGLTVVFSCPLNTTRENWRPQVGPLSGAGFRVVLWDYRGHGRSAAPRAPESYSIEQVVDDLGRVLDWASPGESAVLAGLSFGGLASLHFCLRFPERVRALVLIDSGPGFKNPKAQARWQASCEKTSSFIEARGVAEFAARATELTVGRDLDLPAARAAQAAIAEQSSHGLAAFGRRIAGPAPPVIDELSRIDRPALVIVGEKDEAYLRAAEVMAAKLPRAESVTLAGAGHVVNIEAADAFNAVALAFLERVRAGSA